MSDPAAYYSTPRRLLHWGMAALIIALIGAVELHEAFPKGSTIRSLLMSVHFQFGLLVFVLIWPRLLQTIRHGKPVITPPLLPWQDKLAKLTHLVLYIAMVAMPVVGLLVVQSADKPISFLGLPLPQLIGVDKDLSHDLKEAHEAFGNVVIALLLLHVAATVWHHRILKDDTLTRMLPPRNE